jgi:hypothetical protein
MGQFYIAAAPTETPGTSDAALIQSIASGDKGTRAAPPSCSDLPIRGQARVNPSHHGSGEQKFGAKQQMFGAEQQVLHRGLVDQGNERGATGT